MTPEGRAALAGACPAVGFVLLVLGLMWLVSVSISRTEEPALAGPVPNVVWPGLSMLTAGVAMLAAWWVL